MDLETKPRRKTGLRPREATSFRFGIEEEYFLVDAETKSVSRQMPEAFLKEVKSVTGGQAMGEMLVPRLQKSPEALAKIASIRGAGLMQGIELKEPPEKLVEKGLDRGIVINLTAQKVIRLAPPINIPRHLWEQGLDLLADTIASL